MKTKVSILLTMLALSALATLQAQNFSQDFSGKRVSIVLINATMNIEGHNKNQVTIEAAGYKPPSERAKGLRPLNNGVVDNTETGLNVEEKNGVLRILKAGGPHVTYTIKVPQGAALDMVQAGWQGTKITITNMNDEVEVKTNNASIDIKQVSGPVVVNSTSGNIDLVYSSLAQDKPNALKTISGYIDVTLPGNSKAKLGINNISGRVYSDLDIEAADKGGKKAEDLSPLGGMTNFKGLINGGGVQLKVNSISGDIYLRKAK